MTQTLAGTRNYDLVLGPDGDLVMLTGLAAVVEDARNAMSTKLGECIFNTTRGMPFDTAIFGSYNPAQFEAAGRSLLLTVAGVTAVKTFTVSKKNAVVRYTAQISTIYGDAEVTNG